MTDEEFDPEAALAAIADYPIYLAHNANVDSLTRVDSDLEAALPAPGDTWPEILDSPQALSTALALTMERGTADMLSMAPGLDDWLGANLDPDEQRLGGQAGIMADLVAVLGGDPILYTYLLSATQRALFSRRETIRFPVVDDGDLSFVPLADAPLVDQTKRNWIFEFARGDSFFETTAAADTRFIAASRPDRLNLETGLEPVVDQLGSSVECALVSGYQSLKRVYDDGSTLDEQIDHGAQFLQDLAAQDVTIQMEYAVTYKPELRQAIIDRILPEVHAVGMDARELELLCEDLQHDSTVSDPEIVSQFQQLRALRPKLGVDCIKVHTTNYFLAVMDDYLAPEHVTEGWALSAVVAASKAATGVIDDPADLQTGLDYECAPAGREAMADLAGHLDIDVDGPGIAADADGVSVAAYPNRVVSDPVSTVGLGDSIAVSNFLLENALADSGS